MSAHAPAEGQDKHGAPEKEKKPAAADAAKKVDETKNDTHAAVAAAAPAAAVDADNDRYAPPASLHYKTGTRPFDIAKATRAAILGLALVLPPVGIPVAVGAYAAKKTYDYVPPVKAVVDGTVNVAKNSADAVVSTALAPVQLGADLVGDAAKFAVLRPAHRVASAVNDWWTDTPGEKVGLFEGFVGKVRMLVGKTADGVGTLLGLIPAVATKLVQHPIRSVIAGSLVLGAIQAGPLVVSGQLVESILGILQNLAKLMGSWTK